MPRHVCAGFQFPGFCPDDLLAALDAGFSGEDVIYMFALDYHGQALSETTRDQIGTRADHRDQKP